LTLQRTSHYVYELKNKSLDFRQTQLRHFIEKNGDMFRSKRPSSGHRNKNSKNKVQSSTN